MRYIVVCQCDGRFLFKCFARFFKRDGLLVMSLPDGSARALDALNTVLDRHLARHTMQSASSREGLTSIQITFSGLRTDVARLHEDLRTVLAVESVQTYLDRPGGLH